MRRAKIVVIGAGSAAFGPSVIAGIASNPELANIELFLHDVDSKALDRMAAFADLVIQGGGVPITVAHSTELSRALDGADCVVLAVAAHRERTWARDRALALEHGIVHYAENGGPGAIFHTARNLELILPIAREMERCCPESWLLNYTNPVARICTALKRYTKIRTIGICHQLSFAYYMVGVLLGDELGIEPPVTARFRWNDQSIAESHRIAAETQAKVSIRAAGINHFTWALSITGREDGRDLYPLLNERIKLFDPGFEPLTRRVHRLFGMFPVPGDSHLVESLPYTHNVARASWDRYDIQMYDFDWAKRGRLASISALDAMVAEGGPIKPGAFESERAELVLAALINRTLYLDEALNLPNAGAITNLPHDAIVETPAAILADGPHGVSCGALPESIAELCRRQCRIAELCVRGIVEQRREWLIEALALDPMIDDPDLPEALLHSFERK